MMIIKVVVLTSPPPTGLSKPHHYPKGDFRNAASAQDRMMRRKRHEQSQLRGVPIGTEPRTDPYGNPVRGRRLPAGRHSPGAAASDPSDGESTSTRPRRAP